MRKRLRSPRGLATVHTPEGMPLPPKILVCAVIVKIRDEHRLRGSGAKNKVASARHKERLFSWRRS